MIYLFSLCDITGLQAGLALLALPLLAFAFGKVIWGSYKRKYLDVLSKLEGYKTRTTSLEKELKSLRTRLNKS